MLLQTPTQPNLAPAYLYYSYNDNNVPVSVEPLQMHCDSVEVVGMHVCLSILHGKGRTMVRSTVYCTTSVAPQCRT